MDRMVLGLLQTRDPELGGDAAGRADPGAVLGVGLGQALQRPPTTLAHPLAKCPSASQMPPKFGPGTEHRHRPPRLRINFNLFDYFLYLINDFDLIKARLLIAYDGG